MPRETRAGRRVVKSKVLRETEDIDREISEQKKHADIMKTRNQERKAKRMAWEATHG